MSSQVLDKNDFRICRLEKKDLLALANFVVKENYNHHYIATEYQTTFSQEINSLYCEDICYYPNSLYYAAIDSKNKIIGSIKVTKWNQKDTLPIQKLFDINLNRLACNDTSVWHVGRLAISSNSCTKSITLLKQLMAYAIAPICNDAAEESTIEPPKECICDCWIGNSNHK